MKPITSKKRRRGACDRRSTDPACWRSSRGLPATGWTVADAQKDCWRRCNSNRGYWFSQVWRDENRLLRAEQINVGSLLRDRDYGDRRSTVFTSVTLAVGGTFDYFSSRTGLGREIEELVLPSPFDFYHQALVC